MAKTKETISEKSVTEALKRCKCLCEGCHVSCEGVLHHIFFKSQYYGKDRNTSFNLANLCQRCHRIIHSAGTDIEVNEKNKLDYKLKSEALERRYDKITELILLTNRIKLKIK